MKIGIFTFHRAYNYGAILQCFALQEILTELGNEVFIINYKQNYIENKYKIFDYKVINRSITKPRVVLGYIRKYPKRLQISKYFRNFQKNRLHLLEYNEKSLDTCNAFIIGSDQMWGIHCTGGIDKIYFGEFPHKASSPIYGYAISTNIDSIKSIGKEKLYNYAKNFKTLSFREKNIKSRVEELTNLTCRTDVDPTLLTRKETWNSVINKKWEKENYIVLYQVRYPKNKEILYNKAKALSQKLNCKIIDLSTYKYSPEDFVSIIKYSRCVITSSFHAVIFSLIFERPLFAVKLNDGHDDRYVNILEDLGATDLLYDLDFLPEMKEFKYESIAHRIEKLRSESINYLLDICKK